MGGVSQSAGRQGRHGLRGEGKLKRGLYSKSANSEDKTTQKTQRADEGGRRGTAKEGEGRGRSQQSQAKKGRNTDT